MSPCSILGSARFIGHPKSTAFKPWSETGQSACGRMLACQHDVGPCSQTVPAGSDRSVDHFDHRAFHRGDGLFHELVQRQANLNSIRLLTIQLGRNTRIAVVRPETYDAAALGVCGGLEHSMATCARRLSTTSYVSNASLAIAFNQHLSLESIAKRDTAQLRRGRSSDRHVSVRHHAYSHAAPLMHLGAMSARVSRRVTGPCFKSMQRLKSSIGMRRLGCG